MKKRQEHHPKAATKPLCVVLPTDVTVAIQVAALMEAAMYHA